MKKYIALAMLALGLTVNAQEGPKGPRPQDGPPPKEQRGRPQLTDEQKKQRDALVQKYDVNKDGKLDKEERSKVSEEDRKLLRSFGPPPGGGRPGKPPGDGPRGPRKDGPPPKKEGASLTCLHECGCC